jgi:transketolase
VPDLSVWRPCDTVETAVSWRMALSKNGPSSILFSRQNLAFQNRDSAQLTLIERGGYVLLDPKEGQPDIILIATGSEVALAMEAAKLLFNDRIRARVVSMPSVDTFLAQNENYRNDVLPYNITNRVAIEAAATSDWYRFVGLQGRVVGLDRFGASAPAKDVYQDLGITVERVVIAAKEVIYSAAIAAHPDYVRKGAAGLLH